MPLEILHFPFVFHSAGSRGKCAEIAAFAGFGILGARIETVLSGREFADHRLALYFFLKRVIIKVEGDCQGKTWITRFRKDPQAGEMELSRES